jgi:hypothetical protein
VVALDGTAPFGEGGASGWFWSGPLTPAVATLSDDSRHLFLILANGSWSRSVPCSIAPRSFPVRRVEGVLLSHPDRDGDPLLERKEDLVHEFPIELAGDHIETTLPAHSVAFLTLAR